MKRILLELRKNGKITARDPADMHERTVEAAAPVDDGKISSAKKKGTAKTPFVYYVPQSSNAE